MNLDFSDVKQSWAVVEFLIGTGESDSNNRVVEAVEKALNNPLLDVDIKDAKGALVNVVGGNDLSLEEYKIAVQMIGERLNPDAKLISGARIQQDMENSIKIMVIITGVTSTQITGESISIENARLKDMEGELGIDFFDE